MRRILALVIALLGCRRSSASNPAPTSTGKNPQGGTALRSAADAGHVEVVKLLLARGAKARTRDSFHKLPIDYARENRHADIVALLEKAD